MVFSLYLIPSDLRCFCLVNELGFPLRCFLVVILWFEALEHVLSRCIGFFWSLRLIIF